MALNCWHPGRQQLSKISVLVSLEVGFQRLQVSVIARTNVPITRGGSSTLEVAGVQALSSQQGAPWTHPLVLILPGLGWKVSVSKRAEEA